MFQDVGVPLFAKEVLRPNRPKVEWLRYSIYMNVVQKPMKGFT